MLLQRRGRVRRGRIPSFTTWGTRVPDRLSKRCSFLVAQRLPIANIRHKMARLCPMIDVNNCHTHFALSENLGSLSYRYAAITRQVRRADDVSGLPNRFATSALFFGPQG